MPTGAGATTSSRVLSTPSSKAHPLYLLHPPLFHLWNSGGFLYHKSQKLTSFTHCLIIKTQEYIHTQNLREYHTKITQNLREYCYQTTQNLRECWLFLQRKHLRIGRELCLTYFFHGGNCVKWYIQQHHMLIGIGRKQLPAYIQTEKPAPIVIIGAGFLR